MPTGRLDLTAMKRLGQIYNALPIQISIWKQMTKLSTIHKSISFSKIASREMSGTIARLVKKLNWSIIFTGKDFTLATLACK